MSLLTLFKIKDMKLVEFLIITRMKLHAKRNLEDYERNKVLFVKNATQKMNIGGSKAKNYMNVKSVDLE